MSQLTDGRESRLPSMWQSKTRAQTLPALMGIFSSQSRVLCPVRGTVSDITPSVTPTLSACLPGQCLSLPLSGVQIWAQPVRG